MHCDLCVRSGISYSWSKLTHTFVVLTKESTVDEMVAWAKSKELDDDDVDKLRIAKLNGAAAFNLAKKSPEQREQALINNLQLPAGSAYNVAEWIAEAFPAAPGNFSLSPVCGIVACCGFLVLVLFCVSFNPLTRLWFVYLCHSRCCPSSFWCVSSPHVNRFHVNVL